MLLGKGVGTLVATQKEPRMEGLKFLVVRTLGSDGKETGDYVVAADAVGAGPDEVGYFGGERDLEADRETDLAVLDRENGRSVAG